MRVASASTTGFVFENPTRILVVDDDPLMRESARAYLSMRGAAVETVPDGRAALDLLQTHEFDAALVDIEMPGMGGIELIHRVRAQEKWRQLALIMLTVRDDAAAIELAYGAGATSYLTKPVNWQQLAYQVQRDIRASRKNAAADKPAEAGRPARRARERDAAKNDAAHEPALQRVDMSLPLAIGVGIVLALIMIVSWATTGGPGLAR
jgi:DNA-binding response OmpR family regulator